MNFDAQRSGRINFFDVTTVHQGSLEVARKVLENKADAGIMKTCELEYLYEHNLLQKTV